MQRWIASAAGGTSQRLNPSGADFSFAIEKGGHGVPWSQCQRKSAAAFLKVCSTPHRSGALTKSQANTSWNRWLEPFDATGVEESMEALRGGSVASGGQSVKDLAMTRPTPLNAA